MKRSKPYLWAYGVTTVAERCYSLLPETLASLRNAGFSAPLLFADGLDCEAGMRLSQETLLPVVPHYPKIGAYGNWILALLELYIRQPACHYYAIFQDDILAYSKLREYLETQSLPERAYWNLYTAGPNEPKGDKIGWREGSHRNSRGDQSGIGALGLVFNRLGVQTLLQHQHMIIKPSSAIRARSNIDGAVVESMNKAGFRELVHMPSLLQHTGQQTTCIEGPKRSDVSRANTWKESW